MCESVLNGSCEVWAHAAPMCESVWAHATAAAAQPTVHSLQAVSGVGGKTVRCQEGVTWKECTEKYAVD